jgi:hypothetical protein
MPAKRVLRPDRLRRIPAQFSWIDQRLVREGYIGRGTVHALALYLMLVTVADSRGLSYYGDASISRLLSMPPAQLEQARADLIRLGLIAYERPFYQVLSLEPPVPPRVTGAHSVRAVLSRSPLLVGPQRRP